MYFYFSSKTLLLLLFLFYRNTDETQDDYSGMISKIVTQNGNKRKEEGQGRKEKGVAQTGQTMTCSY